MKLTRCIIGVVFLFFSYFVLADSNPFANSEIVIQSSPRVAKTFSVNPQQSVEDFAVNPTKPLVAILLNAKTGPQQIYFWQMNAANGAQQLNPLTISDGYQIFTLRWHPFGQALFLLGKKDNQYVVVKTSSNHWNPTVIFHSTQTLQNLVVAPRPFQAAYNDQSKIQPTYYRIFFGIKNADGAWTTHSVADVGGYEIRVVDTQQKNIGQANITNNPANYGNAHSALPAAFHPAGHLLFWQDDKNCFHEAQYNEGNWDIIPPRATLICGSSLSLIPNGLAFLSWKQGVRGVALLFNSKHPDKILAEHDLFVAPPQSVADGLGIVGVVKSPSQFMLRYLPVNIPLAQVQNAWMFIESPQDFKLFNTNSGVFRKVSKDTNQLYQLYDTESYMPDSGYDQSTPTRPYLVTTDIFWELYSAAFEGIFVVSERKAAIPAFWDFVHKAYNSLKIDNPSAKMTEVFKALLAVHDGNRENNAEAAQILKAAGILSSKITGETFDYNDLKPRGHYGLDPLFQIYFKALKYLQLVSLTPKDVEILKALPQPVKQSALAWIQIYQPFISPPNAPLIWSSTFPQSRSLHPQPRPQLFPLSWGMDNEIFNNTVNHLDWPSKEQVCGDQGCRVLPSGLDIAVVLGSSFAKTILENSGEFKTFPTLLNQIEKLQNFFKQNKNTENTQHTLYQRWIDGLAVQWANDITDPGNTIQKRLWQTKRLQTGLASWTTLRHATLLVNARTAAEAGEGGYEMLILQPPRGYVEPDPQTFNTIADLFDATIEWVQWSGKIWARYSPSDQQNSVSDVQNGIIRRLEESRDKIRLFATIAAKEVTGKMLTPADYQEIFYVGRAAEHNFLVFKSLAQKDYALSDPDANLKIADVATSQQQPGVDRRFLYVAVGQPLEWDQIVPFYGRQEIVKGAIYSYYEFSSTQILNDSDWQKIAVTQARPHWIMPYIDTEVLSLPPQSPW